MSTPSRSVLLTGLQTSIRTMDLQIANILRELDALGLADRTIIVFTADHGEMAGAHGLHGKSPRRVEKRHNSWLR
jgi:arylsulfatase A-like enzyme